MKEKFKVKEYFVSIQGEGEYLGYKQLFIRFCGCNLKCKYCDTDFSPEKNFIEIDENGLINLINSTKNIHSVSLTGGEPLLYAKKLKNVLKSVNKKIYLETNGTLFDELKEIIEFVDIVAMDVKLNSTSEMGDLFEKHEKFIKIAQDKEKEIYLKVVFDGEITDEEIKRTSNLASKYNLVIVLQPKMKSDKIAVSKSEIKDIFEKFNLLYKNVRLI